MCCAGGSDGFNGIRVQNLVSIEAEEILVNSEYVELGKWNLIDDQGDISIGI